MDVTTKRSRFVIKGRTVHMAHYYSSDVSKGHVQRSVAIIVTSWMKNLLKKLEFLQFLPRFQALPLLCLRNSYLSKTLVTIFGNIVRQHVSADLSR